MSGYPYCVIHMISVMPTSLPDFVLREWAKITCKIINDSEDVLVPFNLLKSAHQIYSNLAPDFLRDVYCLDLWVCFLQMDRLGPLALVTGLDLVSNVRTHSRPVVTFCYFLPLLFWPRCPPMDSDWRVPSCPARMHIMISCCMSWSVITLVA